MGRHKRTVTGVERKQRDALDEAANDGADVGDDAAEVVQVAAGKEVEVEGDEAVDESLDALGDVVQLGGGQLRGYSTQRQYCVRTSVFRGKSSLHLSRSVWTSDLMSLVWLKMSDRPDSALAALAWTSAPTAGAGDALAKPTARKVVTAVMNLMLTGDYKWRETSSEGEVAGLS